MKNLLTIFFLAFASILFAQPVSSTITSDGSVVTIATPVNSKLVPVCNFNWVIVDGNLRMWVTGSNEIIPGGRLKYFTVSGVTDNSLKDEALGAISDQCSGGAGGTLTDGNKGDVTVSDSGAVWNINAGVIGSAEIATGGVGWVDLAQAVKDSIGAGGANLGRILYVSSSGNNSTAEIGNPSKPWADPTVVPALMQDGDVMEFIGSDTFYLHSDIYLDSLQNITIRGNKPTLMRVPESQRNTTLSANYTSGSSITVTSVPSAWKVGDEIRLCKDTTDATGISRNHKIVSIVGNIVTIDYPFFANRYSAGTYTANAGAYVIENYAMLAGRPSLTENGRVLGANRNVKVEGIIFDDGWYLGKPEHKNYSWHYNGCILLHGSGIVINDCVFRNMGNENINGAGMSITNCNFENLGGSAFHYSACDETLHESTHKGVSFANNFVRNCNQIPNIQGGVNINGHDSGAIEYSCNGGEISVIGNQFIHNKRGDAKLMGILTGAEGTSSDRENIIFTGNRCFGYNGITTLDGGSHNLVITSNIFDNCGTLTTLGIPQLDTINTITICANEAVNGTVLSIASRHKCDPIAPEATTLDNAYNNFGATASTVTIDAGEGQTQGMNFDITTTQKMEVATGNTGSFYISRYLKALTPRYNLLATVGNIFLQGTDAGNHVTIQNPTGGRIVRYLESRMMSYDATGSDSLLASGPCRSDNGIVGFNSAGTGWKNSYRFDQITSIASNRFALIEDFGPLNDNPSVQAPNGYALRDWGFTLNGSSGGRQYILNRVGENARVQITGTRQDTTTFLEWNPPITSTGGGFQNWPLDIYSGTAWFRAGTTVSILGNLTLSKTITAGGTTGAQTINNHSGSVNFAIGATSLVVTNSLVTTNSVIVCTVASNDTTMKSVAVVAGSGSFTIHANAAATAETRVNFLITN